MAEGIDKFHSMPYAPPACPPRPPDQEPPPMPLENTPTSEKPYGVYVPTKAQFLIETNATSALEAKAKVQQQLGMFDAGKVPADILEGLTPEEVTIQYDSMFAMNADASDCAHGSGADTDLEAELSINLRIAAAKIEKLTEMLDDSNEVMRRSITTVKAYLYMILESNSLTSLKSTARAILRGMPNE